MLVVSLNRDVTFGKSETTVVNKASRVYKILAA